MAVISGIVILFWFGFWVGHAIARKENSYQLSASFDRAKNDKTI